MAIHRRPFKQGNSTVITLPTDCLVHINHEPGQYVEIRKMANDRLILQAVTPDRARGQNMQRGPDK